MGRWRFRGGLTNLLFLRFVALFSLKKTNKKRGEVESFVNITSVLKRFSISRVNHTRSVLYLLKPLLEHRLEDRSRAVRGSLILI